MGHENYKDAIDAEFDEEVEDNDIPSDAYLNLRCKIAKRTFDGLGAETQALLRKEKDDMHSGLIAAAQEAESQPMPQTAAEDRQR